MIALVLFSTPAFALTNYVTSGSFENYGYNDWEFCCSVYQDGQGYPTRNPDGHVHLGIQVLLAQNVNTVPGREYCLEFFATSVPRVTFGSFEVQDFTIIPKNYLGYEKISCTVTALTSLTRLEFDVIDVGFEIDDIRLGWLFEPLRIVKQPQSVSAIESANALFQVVADGGPPISYQWNFNDTPISDATNLALFFSNVQFTNEGNYTVTVSNRTGAVITSDLVHLSIVPPPESPVILSQPASDTFLVGYGATLGVVALGTPPLQYQWSFNGTDLPNETNSSLVIFAIGLTNEGTYQVLVSNQKASVLSLPATLSIVDPSGLTAGGAIILANRNLGPVSINAPVYDVDGVTLLGGTNFLAQAYVGSSPAILRPLGPTQHFRANGVGAGFFTPPSTLLVPDVPAGSNAYAQARVWDSAYGSTYEEARFRGGKYGASPTAVATTPAAIPPSPPVPVPLETFALQAGLPESAFGRIERGSHQPNGELTWNLIGASGFTYLIEKRQPPQNWVPLVVLTNVTGVVSFTDLDPANASIKFYRSRMLD